MTSADSTVLESEEQSFAAEPAEALLPQHYCGECMAVVYAEDSRCLSCGSARPQPGWYALSDSGDRWLGRIIDERYLVTRRLGRGSSATVYEAESLNINRQFAIKVVDLGACNGRKDPQTLRARLAREVEAIGRLRNPHTVPFYEVLELCGDSVGVVMKYVEGRTLGDLLDAHGPLGWRRAARLLRQIATGVHEAHQAGLIHRDLKPQNIMVEQLSSGDEFVHVLDFGIVWIDDGAEVTQGFVGTPLYASPEQALGESIDRRSDIYSLGAILYCMLTGRPPFESTSVLEVLRMHVRQPPAPLASRRAQADLPRAVERLVERMLSKSKQARPHDLSEVISVLDQLLYTNPNGYPAVPTTGRPAMSTVVDVEQTAPGLGVISNVTDEEASRGVSAGADCSDCVYESQERDQTGPKAAILKLRPLRTPPPPRPSPI